MTFVLSIIGTQCARLFFILGCSTAYATLAIKAQLLIYFQSCPRQGACFLHCYGTGASYSNKSTILYLNNKQFHPDGCSAFFPSVYWRNLRVELNSRKFYCNFYYKSRYHGYRIINLFAFDCEINLNIFQYWYYYTLTRRGKIKLFGNTIL